MILVILAYPTLLLGLGLAAFVAGLCGRAEVVLPRGLRTALAYLTAPLYGFRRVDATTVGYCTVFYAHADAEDLRMHEAYHRFQSLRMCPGSRVIAWSDGHVAYSSWPTRPQMIVGALRYGAAYLVEYLRHGYQMNAFEVEARCAAGQE